MESWSKQLDGRIFFWAKENGLTFEGSHGELSVTKLELDARRFFMELAPHIDLAPINTGSAKRKPARRFDWIYVPATKSADDFRRNRNAPGSRESAGRCRRDFGAGGYSGDGTEARARCDRPLDDLVEPAGRWPSVSTSRYFGLPTGFSARSCSHTSG